MYSKIIWSICLITIKAGSTFSVATNFNYYSINFSICLCIINIDKYIYPIFPIRCILKMNGNK